MHIFTSSPPLHCIVIIPANQISFGYNDQFPNSPKTQIINGWRFIVIICFSHNFQLFLLFYFFHHIAFSFSRLYPSPIFSSSNPYPCTPFIYLVIKFNFHQFAFHIFSLPFWACYVQSLLSLSHVVSLELVVIHSYSSNTPPFDPFFTPALYSPSLPSPPITKNIEKTTTFHQYWCCCIGLYPQTLVFFYLSIVVSI